MGSMLSLRLVALVLPALVFECSTAASAGSSVQTVNVQKQVDTKVVQTLHVSDAFVVRVVGINPLRYYVKSSVATPPPPSLPTLPPVPAPSSSAAIHNLSVQLAPVSLKQQVSDNTADIRRLQNAVDSVPPNDSWDKARTELFDTNGTTIGAEVDALRARLDTMASQISAEQDATVRDAATHLYQTFQPVLSNPRLSTTFDEDPGTCSITGAGPTYTIARDFIDSQDPSASKGPLITNIVTACQAKLIIAAGEVWGAFGNPTYTADAPVTTPTPAAVAITTHNPGIIGRTMVAAHFRLGDTKLFGSVLGSFATGADGGTMGGAGVTYGVAEDRWLFTVGAICYVPPVPQYNLYPNGAVAPGTAITTTPGQLHCPGAFGVTVKL